MANKKGVKIKYIAKDKFSKLTGGKLENAVAIKCTKRQYKEIKGFNELKENILKKEKGNIIVIVDRCKSQPNCGGILSSCVYLGVDAVIFSKQKRPEISLNLAKYSGNASEVIQLLSIKFIKDFLTDAKKEGWMVISADIESDEEREEFGKDNKEMIDKEKYSEGQKVLIQDLTIPSDINESNVVIVLSTKKDSHISSSDYHVTIPPQLDKSKLNVHPYTIIDSLNPGTVAGFIIKFLKYSKY